MVKNMKLKKRKMSKDLLPPVHTHNTRYYVIERACMFFCKGERVPTDKFKEYFTDTAIKSLLKYEFIKIEMT